MSDEVTLKKLIAGEMELSRRNLFLSLGPKGRDEIATPVRAWSRLARTALRPEGPALHTMRCHQSLLCAAPSVLNRLYKASDPRPYGRGY
jgi:hypothetical protein